jgi:hypothetical protein
LKKLWKVVVMRSGFVAYKASFKSKKAAQERAVTLRRMAGSQLPRGIKVSVTHLPASLVKGETMIQRHAKVSRATKHHEGLRSRTATETGIQRHGRVSSATRHILG